MSLPDTFVLPPLPTPFTAAVIAGQDHDLFTAWQMNAENRKVAEQAYALGLADARASMMESAREEAGHEFGLWPIGAVAVVARLKRELAECRAELAKEREKVATLNYGAVSHKDQGAQG